MCDPFFEKFQWTMPYTPECYAPSQTYIDTTEDCNSLGLSLHPPNSMNYYSPLPSTFSNDSNVTLSASSSSKIYGPQFCEPSRNVTPNWNNVTNVTNYHEQVYFNSDITLHYINNLLMQEGSDDKVRLHHGESALRAMEEPFYGLLGQNRPAYPQLLPLLSCDYLKDLDDSRGNSCLDPCTSCPVVIDSSNKHSNDDNLQGSESPWSLSAIVGERTTQDTYRMELGLNISDLSIANKPSRDRIFVSVSNIDTDNYALPEVQNSESYPSCTEDFNLLEGRSNKKFSLSSDEPIRDEMFDKVLLYSGHNTIEGGIVLQGTTATKPTIQQRTSFRRKIKGKKQLKKEVVDLRSLLVHCAEAVSANKHTLAGDIMKTIRQHSSAYGDDSQRLAFCLADCLEIRLAGTGSQIYHRFTSKTCNARDMLKAFQLCLTVCPFLSAPYYLANKTIIDVSVGKPRVHIIDFGICFGFQWASLFQQLAKRQGGPPSVRITGIDVPQPGFRPNQRTMNTGQRLAEYANLFSVPFEYQAISSRWETICVEDLNIQKDDVLIVNCLYRMKNLGDETISINSARNTVLNNIRMMKPNVFVLGEMNGSYSTPFFLARFKEVMYHYSALFDILDKTVPSDNEERMIRQWSTRILQASFHQLPLNPGIVKGTEEMVKMLYHKDYVVNEDANWLLLGWKGRIIYTISTWKPNE